MIPYDIPSNCSTGNQTATPPKLVILDANSIPENVWRGLDYLLGKLKVLPDGLPIPVNHAAAQSPAVLLAVAIAAVNVNLTPDGGYLVLTLPSREVA